MTVLRLFAGPVCIWILAHNQFVLTFWIFFIACLTDWLDGFLARLWHSTSRLGQLLDPLADKILIMGLYMTLSLKGYIPFWLTTVVWARDLLILAIGGFIIVTGKKAALLIPQKLGKMSTALHMIFLGVTLLAPMEGTILYKPGTQNYAMIWFMYGMTIVTVLSGILYGRSALRLFRVHE